MSEKFRELFFNKIFSLRNLFFIFNFLVLTLFIFALSQDFFREWKPYQSEYKKREKARLKGQVAQASDPDKKSALEMELKLAKSRSMEVKQILATDFHRVDRCISCHVGYDSFSNPTLTNDYQDH